MVLHALYPAPLHHPSLYEPALQRLPLRRWTL